MAPIRVTLTKEKETPGTWRYKEDGDKQDYKIGTLYLKRETVADLDEPEQIVVEIERVR